MAGMTLAAHLAAGLNLFAVSPLLPLAIDDYGISRAEAGMLISLPMLVGAFLGIPGGMLTARIGLKRAYMLSWAAMGLLALSAVTPSFPAMLLLRLCYGVGLALMVAASGPLVMQWFRRREILIINALNTAILSLGVAISVAGAVPLAELLGWKTALTVFSGVGVIGAILWPLAPKDRPSAGNTTIPDSPIAEGNTKGGGISMREVVSVLRGRTVALLVAADAGIFVQYTALTGWLPTFYNEARGFSLSEAGFLTSILPFVGIFAVIAGGALPMRFSYRAILLLSGVLAVAGGLGSFLLSPPASIYLSIVALGVGSLALCANVAHRADAPARGHAGTGGGGLGLLYDLFRHRNVHRPHNGRRPPRRHRLVPNRIPDLRRRKLGLANSRHPATPHSNRG